MGVKIDVELDATEAVKAVGGGLWGFIKSPHMGVAVSTTTTTVMGAAAGFAAAGPVGVGLVGLGVLIGSVNSAIAFWALNQTKRMDVHVQTDTETADEVVIP